MFYLMQMPFTMPWQMQCFEPKKKATMFIERPRLENLLITENLFTEDKKETFIIQTVMHFKCI